MEYKFIGWCYEDNHDKVWGVIRVAGPENIWLPATYISFWGARSKSLRTKLYKDAQWHEIDRLILSKTKKYSSVSQTRLHEVYPEFKSDLEKTAMIAILGL